MFWQKSKPSYEESLLSANDYCFRTVTTCQVVRCARYDDARLPEDESPRPSACARRFRTRTRLHSHLH